MGEAAKKIKKVRKPNDDTKANTSIAACRSNSTTRHHASRDDLCWCAGLLWAREAPREPPGLVGEPTFVERRAFTPRQLQPRMRGDKDPPRQARLALLLLLAPFLHVPVEYSRHVHLGRGDLVAQGPHVLDEAHRGVLVSSFEELLTGERPHR